MIHNNGEPRPPRRPIRWSDLRTDEAERIVRERAQTTANVLFSRHAFERIEERSITIVDAFRVLREGYVHEPLRRNPDGDWEAVVARKMPGSREAAVVTIVFRDKDKLFVKTVMWMDTQR